MALPVLESDYIGIKVLEIIIIDFLIKYRPVILFCNI